MLIPLYFHLRHPSVKAVVDMYDGTVSFYIMELSPDLKAQLRYAQDLFGIQATQYETFHMTDPQVFYNREVLWEVGDLPVELQPKLLRVLQALVPASAHIESEARTALRTLNKLPSGRPPGAW